MNQLLLYPASSVSHGCYEMKVLTLQGKSLLLSYVTQFRGKYLILPKPPKVAATSDYSGYGFGQSPSTDQYKVVRFTKIHNPSFRLGCDICTFGDDDAWGSIGSTELAPGCIRNIVFLNRALHWISRDLSKLCYVDIERKEFGNFSLPSHIGGPSASGTVGVVDNCLYIPKDDYFWSVVKIYG